uniref:mRNA m(6)A methyltransferase n=1 Tax=Glossina austeni TaxID=7395 RepID=A0A1A9VX56_GLOAU
MQVLNKTCNKSNAPKAIAAALATVLCLSSDATDAVVDEDTIDNKTDSQEPTIKRLKSNDSENLETVDETDTKATDSGTEDSEIVADTYKESETEAQQSAEDSNNEINNQMHFKKIIQSHTDKSLGDCSFLNTCFHMATCKYVHYEVDTLANINTNKPADVKTNLCLKRSVDPRVTLYPLQWIQCDLRYLDMAVLAKFAVVMADPPWDIHMKSTYGVPALQDDGLICLWVTGRAMVLGRECLMLWGYERIDVLIWVKTNQLQRIIRTGRTGLWLNHGKEHCLVGLKGNPKNLNRGLDCNVIVAEVRATSHKPDDIYGIIERLSPGSVDPELITQFQKPYPDGKCMSPAAPSNVTNGSATAIKNIDSPFEFGKETLLTVCEATRLGGESVS